MGQVYVEAVFDRTNLIKVNLETLLIIHVYHICDTNSVKLSVVAKQDLQGPLFSLDLTEVKHEIVSCVPELARACVWPVITVGNVVIAGLCCVSRQIIKSADGGELRRLLGFKESCLLACSENSVWTRFCEVEIPSAVKNLLARLEDDAVCVPSALGKFECHMRQPVRIHNVYKVARQHHKDKTIKSSVPLEQLNLSHEYGEGPFMTLADVLLFPCFKVIFQVLDSPAMESALPLSLAWFKRMHLSDLRFIQFEPPAKISGECKVDLDCAVGNESLYQSDPNRYKPQSRIYTRQGDVDNSIGIISQLDFDVSNDLEPFGFEVEFDWGCIPLQADPIGGALPQKRASRKREQLENLSKAVIKLAGDRSYTIVDFCSGSGHLGILLATLLPSCQIILIENKERSLLRANERVTGLALNNVTLLQCNLDYFSADFDIGVSLHACGVATDLVIQNCIKNTAHFVCCPCCYGGIHECYHVTYPRSEALSKISYKDYLSVAHAADQTHDCDNAKTKQGYVCMDIIDGDRKLHAEACGYSVHLGKLQPTTCTPKNNLLVGICKTK